MANDGLTIDYAPCGRNGTATLTARVDGAVLAAERVDLLKPKSRDDFAQRLTTDRPGIDRSALDATLLDIAGKLAERPQEPTNDSQHQAPNSDALLASMPESVRVEARVMLESSDLLQRIVDDCAALGIAGETELAATVYLIGTSRLLAKPLAAIVTGHTSSGKSFVPERIARLFPRETLLNATQQTPQALFYLPPGSLQHRFVVAGERSRADSDDAAEATRALREMLASGRLSKLVAMKIKGEMRSELVEQDGPIAYIESTTASNIFDEDANRCLLLNTDERKEQTRRIVMKAAARSAGDGANGDSQRIIDRHHAAQRMLQRLPIVIPFAMEIGDRFASDRVEARRAFPHLLSMIEAVTMLHQRQRQLDSQGRIIATADDYQLARHLLLKPFSRQLGGGVSDGARRFVERLDPFGNKTFTTTEIAESCRLEFCRRAVTDWLKELCDAGLVEQLEPGKGNQPAKWKRTNRSVNEAESCPALPTVEAVFPNLCAHIPPA